MVKKCLPHVRFEAIVSMISVIPLSKCTESYPEECRLINAIITTHFYLQVDIDYERQPRKVYVSLDLMGTNERWQYEDEHTQHVQISLIDSNEVRM